MGDYLRICVIPAYEPDERLIELAKEAKEKGFFTIVVDDGSGENYRAIFDETGAFAHVISYPVNGGKGCAMKAAFSWIKENVEDEWVLVIVDSDGQHRLRDAIRLTEEAARNQDTLILGSRKQSKDSPLRSRLGNGITRNVFRLVSGVYIYDTQTGMRAFSSKLIDQVLAVPGKDMSMR